VFHWCLLALTKGGGVTHVKRGNKSFERAEQFKYWRTNFTKQNVIIEEIKDQTEDEQCLLLFCVESFLIVVFPCMLIITQL
jgi:hypothetical protein